jgi:hypothetical protein
MIDNLESHLFEGFDVEAKGLEKGFIDEVKGVDNDLKVLYNAVNKESVYAYPEAVSLYYNMLNVIEPRIKAWQKGSYMETNPKLKAKIESMAKGLADKKDELMKYAETFGRKADIEILKNTKPQSISEVNKRWQELIKVGKIAGPKN